MGQAKHGLSCTFELARGGMCKDLVAGLGQLPLVCDTQKHHRLQGHAEKASNHADICLIAVALKKFHFCGMPGATTFDLEFQLKG